MGNVVDGTVSDEISSAGFLNEDSLTHAYSPYLEGSFGKTKDFHEFLKKQRHKRLEPPYHQNQLWKRTGLGSRLRNSRRLVKIPRSRMLQKRFGLFSPYN